MVIPELLVPLIGAARHLGAPRGWKVEKEKKDDVGTRENEKKRGKEARAALTATGCN